jgi:hypothetical protein
MAAKMFLNLDTRSTVILSVHGEGKAVPLHLREKFATPELAEIAFRALARRLNLRKRGSGYMRVVK